MRVIRTKFEKITCVIFFITFFLEGDEVFEIKANEDQQQCDITNEEEVAEIQPENECLEDNSNQAMEVEEDSQVEANVEETKSSEPQEAVVTAKPIDEKKND